ncbi:hypothetical protein DYB32_002774 [Aphanomyces invadans]|uniref:Peptidase A1 domain-containing protein n=1 Tax=Aphanomyces invadans TaxID=157072 RepID=A0A418B2H5_9STRA|nr:hypothetical protein DYB32_002774 [Aphanomyces invadans]
MTSWTLGFVAKEPLYGISTGVCKCRCLRCRIQLTIRVLDTVSTTHLGAVPEFPFVAIDVQQEFFKGGYNGILGAIVDSGTTNIVLPPPVYRPLMAMLRDATLQAIPDFPSTYFSDRSVCCEAYCDPTNVNSTLMSLPSLSFSFALMGQVNDQVTVTIPPTYYWRPIAVQSAVGTTMCRMIGLSEGSSTILGNVFMDGLYTVHDRRNGQIGLAVADNCDNLAISTKTISTSAMPSSTASWCDCLSNAELNDNLVTSKLPGQRACFIWYWWTYVFVVSIIVIAVFTDITFFMLPQSPVPPGFAAVLYFAVPHLQNWQLLGSVFAEKPSADNVRNLGIEASGLEERKSFALKIAMDLFNFMSSFSTSSNSNMMVVPTNLLDRWIERFESKYRRDPNFMMKNN